jgi:tagatose-6-phosphate ketose/aldose isomerase
LYFIEKQSFMQILGFTDSELHQTGAFHTAAEIRQQPEVWSIIHRLILEKHDEIFHFMEEAVKKADRLILTGAGTSAFIGISLEADFHRQWGIHARAVPTTDLVTHPGHYFHSGETVFLVSFARSGNSPESCAAVKLAGQRAGGIFHLVITCNPGGKLASGCKVPGQYTLVLPAETNDKGLAMTSSYTGMLLAGLLVSRIRVIDEEAGKARQLRAYGTRILDNYVPALKEVVSLDFKRAIFLGSGPLLGTATESHLKLQELTDGKVVCKVDSYLGFRHGPKAVTDPSTLLVYLFSNVPYVLRYERDLVDSMGKGHGAMYSMGIMESPFVEREIGDGLDLKIRLSDQEIGLDEEYLAICNVIPAQLLGLFKSLHLGLRPDNPSVSGAISRVVEGVQIYPYD